LNIQQLTLRVMPMQHEGGLRLLMPDQDLFALAVR